MVNRIAFTPKRHKRYPSNSSDGLFQVGFSRRRIDAGGIQAAVTEQGGLLALVQPLRGQFLLFHVFDAVSGVEDCIA